MQTAFATGPLQHELEKSLHDFLKKYCEIERIAYSTDGLNFWNKLRKDLGFLDSKVRHPMRGDIVHAI